MQMTFSETQLHNIKENYAQLILDGMDMRSLEAFAMDSIMNNMEMWDEKDIKEEVLDYYGEEYLENYYEDYCDMGETYSYEAVDVFCEEFGVDNIGNFADAFYGEYETPAIFCEHFIDETTPVVIPDCVVVDWDATWECNLRHDFIWEEGFVFNRNF